MSISETKKIRETKGAGEHAACFVTKIANAEIEETGNGFDVFAFAKRRGAWGEVPVPCNESHSPKLVMRKIREKNGLLPKNLTEAEVLVEAAIAAEPQKCRLYSSGTGWRPNNSAFVLLDRTISYGDSDVEIWPPAWSGKMGFVAPDRKGTSKDWSESIGSIAAGSSRLILAMSCMFAAPLLRHIGRPSFIINLYGPAKSGKSTALLAAASAFGIATEEGLPNWNATGAGLLSVARLFNDMILPMNELALVRGKKGDQRDRIRELTYAYAEGRDTTRHGESTFATPASSATFRGILLSTAENSFRSMAAKASETQDAGEVARAHDIPALPRGATSIFDLDVGGHIDSSEARERLRCLRVAMTQSCGRSFERYVRWIARRLDDVPALSQELADEFRKSLELSNADQSLVHAADNFAALYAGGALAIEADIVPWDRALLMRALRGCFDDFRAEMETSEQRQIRAWKMVTDFLDSGDFKKGPVSALTKRPKDGVRIKKGGHAFYVVPSKRFDEIFPSLDLARLALIKGDSRNAIVRRRKSGNPTCANKSWAEVFAKGNGMKFRAIKIKRRLKNKTKK